MRVLVISLLRLGDFIQILPVLQSLKTQFNIAELDVLTHQPVRQMQPMLTSVDKWFTLNRDELQAGLGEAGIPMLTSLSVLKEQLDRIDQRKYDCIINLTQTEFSGWIAGYLSASQRYGLTMDVKGQAHFHSPWFQYLDDHAPLGVEDIFHYTDIFFYGCGLKGADRIWNLRETRHGRAEMSALQLSGGDKIVLQTLTSDSKKNWSEQSWVSMLTQLHLFQPHAEFVALGAPNEESRIDSLVARAQERGISVRKAILSLEGAYSLLRQARLLITGDTSIKHLANAANIPILELSLGSSDLRRTGAYRANSLILQSRVECAPCPHSSPCSQSTHACAARLSPDVVSLAAHHYLSSDWMGLKELSHEFENEVKLLRTRQLSNGFWLAVDLNESEPERVIERLLERCTWKFLLNRDHLNPLAQFGSEGLQLKRELEAMMPDRQLTTFTQHLGFLESQAGSMGEKATSLLSTVARRTPAVEDIKDFLRQHQPFSSALSWLENNSVASSGDVVAIGGLRRMQSQLERFQQQSQVKMKLIRSLKSQIMEIR